MQSTRNYTVSLPLIQGPDLIDALTSFCDDDRHFFCVDESVTVLWYNQITVEVLL